MSKKCLLKTLPKYCINEQSPFFSIVIPLYNNAEYIERCLNSVLNQDFIDYEIIVVNDGSTDGSENVVADLFLEKVKLVNQYNKGVSVARNKGVTVSSGEWIAFLDSDDEWSESHLSELYRIINFYTSIDFVSTKSKEVDRCFFNRGKKNQQLSNSAGNEYRLINIWRFVIDNPGFIQTSSIAIKRTVFLEVGGFKDVRLGEDTELYCRVNLKYKCAVSYKETSYYHRGTMGVMETAESSSEIESISSIFDVRFAAGYLSTLIDELPISQKIDAEYFINGSVYSCYKRHLYKGNFPTLKILSKMIIRPKELKFKLLSRMGACPLFLLSIFYRSRLLLRNVYLKVKA
ncbi:beta-1,3-glucosyltransferase [Vibrio maritimus]|uniref:Beta-1,3-glucosyltransferase n=1 Tax=Vibrio maritimus TaxID=990268 RepID=A0A090TCD8_9VIBR|nr:beta-1,3-glucosyltransferase [Vibrio maritimus]